jgi:hypothetical protein
MFDTLIGLVALLAFVLPGFIVTQLAESRRASKGSGGDLEIVLRSLWYSVALHLVALASGWTSLIYADIETGNKWEHHVLALGLYLGAVVFVVPVLLGMLLSYRLRSREQRGQLRGIDYALGGRDARRAWDFLFEHLDGGFVIVQLKVLPDNLQPTATASGSWNGNTIVGKFGKLSWATQTPSPRYDVFFEEVWPADEAGRILGEFVPPRGLWLDADNVAALYCVEPSLLTRSGEGVLRRTLLAGRQSTELLSSSI